MVCNFESCYQFANNSAFAISLFHLYEKCTTLSVKHRSGELPIANVEIPDKEAARERPLQGCAEDTALGSLLAAILKVAIGPV